VQYQSCALNRNDCTPAEVTATLDQLYQLGGATPKEAACIAAITGKGKHAVNEPTKHISTAEAVAALRCVGTAERLVAIANGVAKYWSENHLGGEPPRLAAYRGRSVLRVSLTTT
jgi:hypothetical protein